MAHHRNPGGAHTSRGGNARLSNGNKPLYYHPNLSSMTEVIKTMKPYAMTNGAFLLRNSFSKPGVLTVSVIHEQGIKHFNITYENNMYCVFDHPFQSMSDLVLFYEHNDVPNIELVRNVRLKFPIPCANCHGSSEWTYTVADQSAEINARLMTTSVSESSSDIEGTPERLRSESVPNVACASAAGAAGPLDFERRNMSACPLVDCPSDDVLTPQPKTFREKLRHILDRPKLKNGQVISDVTAVSPIFRQQPPIPVDNNNQDVEHSENVSPNVLLRNPLQTSSASEQLYYSAPRDVEQKISQNLMSHLRQEEEEDDCPDGRCVCGLDLNESELPRGWSLHISTEPSTAGRLFFTSPDGKTTWNLPLAVSIELDPEQQDRIRNLLLAGHHLADCHVWTGGSGVDGNCANTAVLTSSLSASHISGSMSGLSS